MSAITAVYTALGAGKTTAAALTTATVAAGATAGTMAATGAFSGKGGFKSSSAQVGDAKRTAAPVEQLSEQAKKNRRLAASFLTRDWGEPRLGKAGLLGLGGEALP